MLWECLKMTVLENHCWGGILIKLGRPRTRFMDNIEEDLRTIGVRVWQWQLEDCPDGRYAPPRAVYHDDDSHLEVLRTLFGLQLLPVQTFLDIPSTTSCCFCVLRILPYFCSSILCIVYYQDPLYWTFSIFLLTLSFLYHQVISVIGCTRNFCRIFL